MKLSLIRILEPSRYTLSEWLSKHLEDVNFRKENEYYCNLYEIKMGGFYAAVYNTIRVWWVK